MGHKILIIDDDRKFLKIVEDALSPRGYEVITANNGEQGLQFFRTQHPDLVLLDILLPKIDGFKLCEEIRKDPHGKHLPIFMMTALYKMPAKEREARNVYRVKEYLTKPIDLKKLLELLARALPDEV